MAKPFVVVGLGEVLWDILPSGKVLGGAPANFAYMANVLGDQGIVASRVGTDQLGHEVREALAALDLTTRFLQEDPHHETGSAKVLIDTLGQPTFTITESVSWDFLEWTPGWEELSQTADVICFGSLAQRSSISAGTIDCFLQNARSDVLRIFDVNLRQSYYRKAILRRSLQHANIVKLTDQELYRLSSLLQLGSGSDEILARALLRQWDLRLVCVTRGARGSLLVSEEEIVEHHGYPVQVVDTVGAGDAFTASLVHHFIRGRSLREISECANQFASWVATQTGAMPRINQLQLQQIKAGNA
jgi:fructokinase